MVKYTFEKIKDLLLKSINEGHIETEIRLIFKDKGNKHMVII